MTKRGRPSDYGPEITSRICTEIANGRSLRTICKDDDMPAMSTVFKWLSQHDEFAEQYARARATQADVMAEEILEIADDGRNDTQVTPDGAEIVNHDHIARSRLRVDARKWLASKLKPKVYGDRLEHAGSVGVSPFDKLGTPALAALVAALSGTGGDPGGGEGGTGSPAGS